MEASEEAAPAVEEEAEDEEEYVPCNSVDQLVDLGIDEPYSPSRPGLLDATGSAYVPAKGRPSVRVIPTVPATQPEAQDRGNDKLDKSSFKTRKVCVLMFYRGMCALKSKNSRHCPCAEDSKMVFASYVNGRPFFFFFFKYSGQRIEKIV